MSTNDIMGYSWSDINAMQHKQYIRPSVDVSKPVDHSLINGDLELFEKHGIAGLQSMGFSGVVDRLQRNGYK